MALLLGVAAAVSGCMGEGEPSTTSGASSSPRDEATGGGGGSKSSVLLNPSAGASSKSTGGMGDTPGPGEGTAGQATASISKSSYFDVALSKVDVAIQMGPGANTPPSEGLSFRFDIPEKPSQGKWLAVVTPRWGQAATFDIEEKADALVLSGMVTVSRPLPGGTINDVWQSFTIPLASTSTIAPVVSATGEEDIFVGDVGYTGKLSASGSLSKDATKPEARCGFVHGVAPDDLLLPWDTVQVAFSEPVPLDDALTKLSLGDPATGEQLFSVAWEAAPQPVDVKATGASMLLGYVQSWEAVGGAPAVQVAAGYRDPAGNSGEAVGSAPLSVKKVPAPVGDSNLLSDPSTYLAWGAFETLSTEQSGCESTGCVKLGSVSLSGCGVEASGLALRLMTDSSGSKLKVRLRTLYTAEPGSPDAPPYVASLPAMTVQLARPGKSPTMIELAAIAVDDDLGAEAGDFRFATSWKTAAIDIPPGSGELGVALRLGGLTSRLPCENVKKGPSVKMQVLIESVVVE